MFFRFSFFLLLLSIPPLQMVWCAGLFMHVRPSSNSPHFGFARPKNHVTAVVLMSISVFYLVATEVVSLARRRNRNGQWLRLPDRDGRRYHFSVKMRTRVQLCKPRGMPTAHARALHNGIPVKIYLLHGSFPGAVDAEFVEEVYVRSFLASPKDQFNTWCLEAVQLVVVVGVSRISWCGGAITPQSHQAGIPVISKVFTDFYLCVTLGRKAQNVGGGKKKLLGLRTASATFEGAIRADAAAAAAGVGDKIDRCLSNSKRGTLWGKA